MSSLPPELWLAAFDILRLPAPKDDIFPDLPPDISNLQNVSLTCRYFRQLSEPFFYERFTLRVDEEDAEMLIGLLEACPEKRLWIKYLIFFGDADGMISPVYAPLPLHHFTNLIPEFRELKGVKFSDVELPIAIISKVLQRPELEVWDSHNLTIEGDDENLDVDPETIPLRRLRMTRIKRNVHRLIRLAKSPSLEALNLEGDLFEIPLGVDALDSEGTPFRNLRYLILRGLHLDLYHLLPFLEQCTNVTRMNIGGEVHTYSLLHQPFPTSILPHLQRFEGGSDVAKTLVPFSPVEYISLDHTTPLDVLANGTLFNVLATSSRPVKSLHAKVTGEWRDGLLADIANALTALEDLCLDVSYADEAPDVSLKSINPQGCHAFADCDAHIVLG